jgi:hypothetical protein
MKIAMPVKKLTPKKMKRKINEKINATGNFAIEARYSEINCNF